MDNENDFDKELPTTLTRRTALKNFGMIGITGGAVSQAAGIASDNPVGVIGMNNSANSIGIDEYDNSDEINKDDGFDVIEATADEIQESYRTGQMTVQSVVKRYIERIQAYEATLDAIIRINPNVLKRARELDTAFKSDGPAGPLHGIPILLKDNIDTDNIPTTAGSVSMKYSQPPDDATIVSSIRKAGAVILAKANLDEFAFGYSTISSLGGLTHNPYDLARYAGGSSGGPGAGIAANLGVLGIGTDTGGSVRVPAAANSLVGLRPSTGLVSRDGIVPLALTEDTAGPMTRTVTDAALLLDSMVVGYDPADSETAENVRRTPHSKGKSYTDFLKKDGLKGSRIGVYRDYVGANEEQDDKERIADARAVAKVFNKALSDLKHAGATVIDPVKAPSWDFVYSANVSSSSEFNRDINSYLANLDGKTPNSLKEIAASNEYAPGICESLRSREEVDEDALDENVDYLRTLSKRDDIQEFVLGTMAENDLDAIVYPALRHTPPHIDSDESWGANAQLTPALEFPSMTVPAGYTAEDLMPVGIEFLTREYQEKDLFRLTYAYEQESQTRQPPEGFGKIYEKFGPFSAKGIRSWNEHQHKNRTAERLGCNNS